MNVGHVAGGPLPFGLGGGSGGAEHNGDGSSGGGGGGGRGGVISIPLGEAAPDGGVVSVCNLCNMRRADLRGACGHKYHARCIYSMPITRCPFCDQKFPSDNEGGLFILPVEPFATDADTAAAKPSGDSEDDRVDRDGEPQTRTGRWHSYETMYAQRIVADFDAGTMPLCEGTKLGGFLCNILNCSPSRLSKKLKIGKKCFQRCPDRPMDAEHIARHQESQKRLSDLEEMFLMAESRANRGMTNAEVLSACIQKEWRERLVEHALAVSQRLKNAWDWNAGRKRAERKRAELSTDALNKLLQTITPNQSSDTASVNHLAPLFLVNHAADKSGGGGGGGSGGGAAAGAGAGTGLQMQNALLAQAMAHVLRSWQQGQCVPASDLFDPDLQAWQQGQQAPVQEASWRPPPSAGVQAGQQEGAAAATAQQARVGDAAVSPDMDINAVGMKGFTEDQLTSLESNLASLAKKNSVAIEEMDLNIPPGTPFEQGQHIQGTAQGQQGNGDGQGMMVAGKGAKDSSSSLADSSMSTMDVESTTSSTPDVAAMAAAAAAATAAGGDSSSAASLAPKTELIAPDPSRPAGQSNPAGYDGGSRGGTGRSNCSVAGGGGGGSALEAAAAGNSDGALADDDHPFEVFIANFLDQVPFEAVDVWVPLCDQDHEASEVVLFHAGFFTNVKDLDEWGDYSTNFSFRQGQGIPGRVFGTNQSEFHENVMNLDLSMFLRLNGARKIGIGTSFALPVVSRWGVTFVIVFYTRSKIQLDMEKKVYIESVVRSWKLDATVDTVDDQKDSSRAAANATQPGAAAAAVPPPAPAAEP